MLRMNSAIGQQRIAKPADGGGHNIQLIINLVSAEKRLSERSPAHRRCPTVSAGAICEDLVIFNQHQPGKAHRHPGARFFTVFCAG